MAYFSLTELAAFLQTDLNTSTATLCQTGAEESVRDFCGQEFEAGSTTRTFVPRHGSTRVRIPYGPVTAVASVTTEEGLLSADEWTWDGVSPWIDLDAPAAAATVAYSYGWATVPGTVKAVALGVAARAYANPLGLKTEAVDDYQTTYAPESPFALTRGERLALRRYRAAVTTLEAR